MVNVAVVGYGFAGKSFHSYLVGLEERLHLHTISTRNPERQARAREGDASQMALCCAVRSTDLEDKYGVEESMLSV